jgi:poly-beta-1,6-N-acetyl-D-glucosamine biosynthesis protein PgaD
MRTLIIDQYTQQSIFKQQLGNTLTGLAWGFWIYLWLPLVVAITMLLGPHPEQATSAASHSILALLKTLVSHGSVVVIMILAFFGWSLLQFFGKRSRREALRKQEVKWPCTVVSPTAQETQDMRRWRHVQCLVVTHDNAGGFITQVEIVKAKSQVTQGKLPPACLQTVLLKPKRHYNSIATSVHV